MKEKRLTKRRWKALAEHTKEDVLTCVFPNRPEIISLLLKIGYDTSLFWWGIVYSETRLLVGGDYSARVGKTFIL